jgi:hypothetical protein
VLNTIAGLLLATGAQPTPAYVAAMGSLQATLSLSPSWGSALATPALVLMAVARNL